jgi:hypothetical protein
MAPGVGWIARWLVLAAALHGCSAALKPEPAQSLAPATFFPLTPDSRWEYAVSRHAGHEVFQFIATVQRNDFVAPDGQACRVVDERYTDVGGGTRFPVLYCSKGGYLHRVMSLEYRGEVLEDNGLKSGELKFLPTDLGQAQSWEGWTNAYRLPDGSGFEVRQLHERVPQTEHVVVPAGQFADCVRVDTTAIHSATGTDGRPIGPRTVFYYADWYAPGVGLVKTEQRNAQAEVLATIELVRFEIAAGAPSP